MLHTNIPRSIEQQVTAYINSRRSSDSIGKCIHPLDCWNGELPSEEWTHRPLLRGNILRGLYIICYGRAATAHHFVNYIDYKLEARFNNLAFKFKMEESLIRVECCIISIEGWSRWTERTTHQSRSTRGSSDCKYQMTIWMNGWILWLTEWKGCSIILKYQKNYEIIERYELRTIKFQYYLSCSILVWNESFNLLFPLMWQNMQNICGMVYFFKYS